MERELLLEKDWNLIKAAYLLGYERGYDSNYDNVIEALKHDETDLELQNLLFEHGEEIYVRNSDRAW